MEDNSDIDNDFDEDNINDSMDGEDDSEYDYTGEDSNAEDVIIEERCRFEWQDEEEDLDLRIRNGLDGSCVDWEYCERDKQTLLLSQRMEAPQVYAPERGPPLLDFLFVLTAFFAATFAAFYTILSETGAPSRWCWSI